MAALSFRLFNANAGGGGVFTQLQEANATAATSGTGWTVAKSAANTSAEMATGTEQASTTFTANAGAPKPGTPVGASGNAFRTEITYNGTFDNANWSIQVAFRSVTVAYSGTIRARMRIFRGGNPDGSGATELTSATLAGTTSAAGSTSADTTSTVTWTPGGTVTVTSEYLFFTVACEIITASGSNTADALIRTGSATTPTGTVVTTANFTSVAVQDVVQFAGGGYYPMIRDELRNLWRPRRPKLWKPGLWLPEGAFA